MQDGRIGLIGRIEADIRCARMLQEAGQGMPFAGDVAAFLVQQAAEKSLKYVLSDVHGEPRGECFYRLHDVGELLRRVEALEPGFSAGHPELAAAVPSLVAWDEDHAGDGEEPRAVLAELAPVLGIAERLYEEVRAIDAERRASGVREQPPPARVLSAPSLFLRAGTSRPRLRIPRLPRPRGPAKLFPGCR